MRPETQSWLRDVQRQQVEVLRTLVGDRRFAYLDLPTYQNVGDSLIWQGTVETFGAAGLTPSYISDIGRFDAGELRRRVGRKPLILLQGGGNFGDVWPRWQEFRERIAATQQDATVVQLPQSVHFASHANAVRANRVLGSHPDFTLLVREYASYARARQQLPDVRVELLPDMALGIRSMAGKVLGERRHVLALARRDHEQRHSSLAAEARRLGIEVIDWGLDGARSSEWNRVRRPLRVSRILPSAGKRVLYGRVTKSYERMRQLNVEAGLEIFCRASVVVTDRLHAHVLAGLLEIPCVLLDNSYGKLSAVYESYTHQFENARLAGSVEEAVALLAAQ